MRERERERKVPSFINLGGMCPQLKHRNRSTHFLPHLPKSESWWDEALAFLPSPGTCKSAKRGNDGETQTREKGDGDKGTAPQPLRHCVTASRYLVGCWAGGTTDTSVQKGIVTAGHHRPSSHLRSLDRSSLYSCLYCWVAPFPESQASAGRPGPGRDQLRLGC